MLATRKYWGCALLIFAGACGNSRQALLSENPSDSFSRSVSYLDPERFENQLSNEDAYGQVILTVENDLVIQELNNIVEIKDAIGEITFIRSNNSFQSIVYVVKFKKNINPIPYYNFMENYEGVVAVEFDGIIGLAAKSD